MPPFDIPQERLPEQPEKERHLQEFRDNDDGYGIHHKLQQIEKLGHHVPYHPEKPVRHNPEEEMLSVGYFIIYRKFHKR
jgi:hypothetical protein